MIIIFTLQDNLLLGIIINVTFIVVVVAVVTVDVIQNWKLICCSLICFTYIRWYYCIEILVNRGIITMNVFSNSWSTAIVHLTNTWNRLLSSFLTLCYLPFRNLWSRALSFINGRCECIYTMMFRLLFLLLLFV